MGEAQNQPFQLSFNPMLKVEFQGSRVTSDGGLILVRELDERLGFSGLIAQHLTDPRGPNTQFPLADLVRQSVYRRLAGYEDVNNAERLSQDPTFRLIGSEQLWERGAALTSRGGAPIRGPAIRVRVATIVTVGLVAALLWPQAPMWSAAGAELVALAAPQPKPVLWTFDGDPAGGLPGGARVFSGQWSVRREADAPSRPNALCQTAVARFPAILLTPTRYADVVVEARFKTISGGGDQAAGIIFRVRDPDNYYVLRANALENNVILFRYANGTRFGIAGADVDVPKRKWQTLRVEAVASRIRGFLNGKRVLETTDTAFNAGGIGLWTKADSETCFDDVRVTVP